MSWRRYASHLSKQTPLLCLTDSGLVKTTTPWPQRMQCCPYSTTPHVYVKKAHPHRHTHTHIASVHNAGCQAKYLPCICEFFKPPSFDGPRFRRRRPAFSRMELGPPLYFFVRFPRGYRRRRTPQHNPASLSMLMLLVRPNLIGPTCSTPSLAEPRASHSHRHPQG